MTLIQGDALGVSEIAAAVGRQEVDPRDLLIDLGRRVSRAAELNAICAIDGSVAAETKQLLAAGPLLGVPIGVKDSIAVPWRAAHDGTSVVSLSVVPGTDSAVHRLEAAGAIPAVATSMHQLGMGTTGHVSATGPARNPFAPDHVAGGSSGGSAAAVSAGVVSGALGTDAGGSVRIPAAYCGVVGLKPTWGAVPMKGCTSEYSTVAVIGPLARSVGDCRLLAEVLLGRTLATESGRRWRCAKLSPFWDDIDPEVAALCARAIELLAPEGTSEAQLSGAEHVAVATMIVTGTERLPQMTPEWIARVFPTLDPSVRAILKSRARLDAASVQRVTRYRTLLRRRVQQLFERFELLVWPTVPAPAPLVDAPRLMLPSGPASADAANLQLVGLANLTGIPAINVPVGVTGSGLPVGLALHSPWGREEDLLAAAEDLRSEHSPTRVPEPSELAFSGGSAVVISPAGSAGGSGRRGRAPGDVVSAR